MEFYYSLFYIQCITILDTNNDRDSEAFPLIGVSRNANNDTSMCISNLKKLNNCIERYLKNELHINIDKESINIQEIAEKQDRHNLNLLVFILT